MPIRAIDHHHAGTFDWTCRACGCEHTGWALDPTKGDIETISDHSITLRPCTDCGSFESLMRQVGPWDTGEQLHPDSQVGLVLPGGAIVTDHHVAGWIESGLTEEHRQAARMHRMMQQHPHLAAHAPLATNEQMLAHTRRHLHPKQRAAITERAKGANS